MTRAIFQAGMSWALIERKWPAFEAAFEGFDPVLVAAFGEGDIERLMEDDGLIRSRKKIAGTVENARTLLEIERSQGFKAYLRSFPDYAALSADLKRRFAFLGELSVYYMLFRAGDPVPVFEEWETTVPGDHPRMREMVLLDREESGNSDGRGTVTG